MSTIHQSLKILEIKSEHIGLPEAKQAYRRLIKEWHPDKFQRPDDILVATQKSEQINNSYELITEHIETYGPIILTKHNIRSQYLKSIRPQHRYSNHTFNPGFPDETVFEVFVKSSHIVSVGYNPINRKLYIKYNRGDVYEYSDVPVRVWQDFVAADSLGKFANRFIYKSFPYRMCTEANKPYNPEATMLRSKFLSA